MAANSKLKCQVLTASSKVEGRTNDFIIQSGGSNAISSGPLDLPFWRPILLGAGIVVPKARITWAKFTPVNNSDAIHQFEGYETNTPNRAAILIRNLPDQDMRTEYWVDPDRDFVVTKFLLQASGYDGAVSKSIVIDYRTVGETWFPVAWRATNSSVDLRYTEDIQVSEIVINGSVSDEEFRLEPEAGMKVYAADVQVNESNRVITVATENYQVGSGNQKAGLVSHTRVYGKPPVLGSSPRQSPWFRFAFLGFLMASGIFLMAAAALRRAKGK